MERAERILNLSGQLSEYIIENYEEKILRKILAAEYGYFLPYECEEILDLARKNVPRCQKLIAEKMRDYLEDNNTLFLDGFVNFRLKEYKFILAEVIENSVREYLIKKEYDAFISFIKSFLALQPPVYGTVHLLYRDGEIELYSDENDYIIRTANFDAVLDSLLDTAPIKVVLHDYEKIKTIPIINTIANIFGDKIEICNGCGICGKIQ